MSQNAFIWESWNNETTVRDKYTNEALGTITFNMTFLGLEDICVSAECFDSCAKIGVSEENSIEDYYAESTMWFAENIGFIKADWEEPDTDVSGIYQLLSTNIGKISANNASGTWTGTNEGLMDTSDLQLTINEDGTGITSGDINNEWLYIVDDSRNPQWLDIIFTSGITPPSCDNSAPRRPYVHLEKDGRISLGVMPLDPHRRKRHTGTPALPQSASYVSRPLWTPPGRSRRGLRRAPAKPWHFATGGSLPPETGPG